MLPSFRGSSLACCVHDNTIFETIENRTLSDDARQTGFVRDVVVRFTGPSAIKSGLNHPTRLVEVKCKPHRKTDSRSGPSQSETVLITTDILDVPAHVIALIHKHRWAIKIFFRFFKHVPGYRHLISHRENGIEIQTYLAIIACLLIALWTGKKADAAQKQAAPVATTAPTVAPTPASPALPL